jgi:hypothetical protein
MASYTADDLYTLADHLDGRAEDPRVRDHPAWLRRWADDARRLAAMREAAQVHKAGTQRRRWSGARGTVSDGVEVTLSG